MYSLLTKILDLYIRFNTITNYLPVISKQFIVKDDIKEDIIITSSYEKIEIYKKKMPEELQEIGFCENLSIMNELASKTIDFNGVLIHAAAISIENHGIIFTGKSGIGKTTHLKLWQQLLGGKVTTINGDKPFIRVIGDVPFVYGSPWQGDERIGINGNANLMDICFLEQANENSITKLDRNDAFQRLIKQIHIPNDPQKIVKVLSILECICNKCNFWLLKCNPTIESAKIVYEALILNRDFANKNNEVI